MAKSVAGTAKWNILEKMGISSEENQMQKKSRNSADIIDKWTAFDAPTLPIPKRSVKGNEPS